MSIGIVCSTRNRPHLIKNLITNLYSSTNIKFSLYFATTDEKTNSILDEFGIPYKKYDQDATATIKYNWLFQNCEDDFIYGACDDVYYQFGWLDAVTEDPINGIASISDGLRHGIGTTAIVSKQYLEDFGGTMDNTGYILHSGYIHNYAETEAFGVAKHRGMFRYCKRAKSLHKHHTNGLASYDDTYEKSDAAWEHDGKLFDSRRYMWE